VILGFDCFSFWDAVYDDSVRKTMAREESDMSNDGSETNMNDQSVICDPGHDRTVRELAALSRESRELVWADMIGADPPIRSNRTSSSPTPSTRDETSSTALEESLARME